MSQWVLWRLFKLTSLWLVSAEHLSDTNKIRASYKKPINFFSKIMFREDYVANLPQKSPETVDMNIGNIIEWNILSSYPVFKYSFSVDT